jgi:hypothetical protein
VAVFGMADPGMAIQPVWNSYGWLLLKAESGEGRMHTGYWAIVGGTETWLNKYYWHIQKFCYGNDNYAYWTTLPYYGYTQVTAKKLARLIWNDSDLQLHKVPSKVVDKIAWALQADHDSKGVLPKGPYDTWDPLGAWKWRSVYMERMYAEKNRTEDMDANCWGTANYLTRSFEWAAAYPANKQKALNSGRSVWAATFPHIFLDGPVIQGKYSFDNDLLKNKWRFALKGTCSNPTKETCGTYPGLQNIINSFDIIRISGGMTWGTYENLVWNDQDLGLNQHGAVYICTDRAGNAWFYEKANTGPPASVPSRYDLNTFGRTPGRDHQFRSFFRHDGDYKKNLADSYDIDWANVEP